MRKLFRTLPSAGFLILIAASAAAQTASPLAVKIGGMEFAPGGFLDFTTVYRSTAVGSGIGTNFAKIPYNDTPSGRLSELRLSAQNSRLSLKMSGEHDGTEIAGYLEADFLGNAPTNLDVSSNSNTLRMRVFFVDLRHGSWEMLAGQDWGMLTPNRVGLSPMPSDIFYGLVGDTNYQVGLTWTRQPQFRVLYHATPQWTAGISLEQGENYIGGSGSPTVTLPGGPNGPYAAQVNNGASGTAAPGFTPDLVGKVAFDSKPSGQGLHLELAALESNFRVLSAATGATTHAAGGGLSLNGNWAIAGGLRLIGSSFLGDGGGRYFLGMAPDMIIRQDGSISPVRASGGLAGAEWQVDPQEVLYAYYGGVAIGRDFDLSGATPVGYGFAGAGNSVNKSVQEASLGQVRTFWKSAEFGSIQLLAQASYVTRAPFDGTPGTARYAHAAMGWLNLRYNLP
ncbi:MAG TPA: hypothetical protein VN690_12595 [Terriglobales bacterium]|nr:hypothetical protein [Terriglobales bacterium]